MMKLILCGPSALQFWRACDVSPRRLSTRCAIPPAFTPSLLKVEQQYLSTRFGLQGKVFNLVERPEYRRDSQLAKCVVGPETLASGVVHIGKQLYVESPESTVLHLAAFLASALKGRDKTSAAIILATIICELTGNYRLAPTYEDGFRTAKPLTTAADIRELLRRPHVPGGNVASMASLYALDNSNSPAESTLSLFEVLPKPWGGMGIRKPELNKRVSTAERRKGTRFPDQCWEAAKRVVEYNGGYHEGERANDDDARRNALISRGYTVNVVNKTELFDAEELGHTLDDLAKSVGSSGRRPADYAARRAKMRSLVFETSETDCAENSGALVPAEVKPAPYTLSRL